MNQNELEKLLERHFDGEGSLPDNALADNPGMARYQENLAVLRNHMSAKRTVAEIADPQFNGFMAGIREQTAAKPASHWGRWLTLASLTAASLVISAASFYIVAYGPSPVEATEVEMVSTDLEGASTREYTEDGITTVWVSVAEDDL